jgi:hypothetical protein
VRDRLDELGGAAVAAVTFASAAELGPHRDHLELPFPLLADPDREIYRRFELGRGRLRDVWSPGTIAMYVSLLRRGRRLRRPTQDTRQLGGDFVVDSAGRLSAAFRPTSPDDRPTPDQLIAAVAAAH